MPLSVQCPACGTKYKAPDAAAGRTLACLNCRAPMTVPSAEALDPAAILMGGDDPPPPPEPDSPPDEPEFTPPIPRKSRRPKTVDVASLPPLTANEPPFWRRHLHWLLVLALIPLIVALLVPSANGSIEERIARGIDQATPTERERIFVQLEKPGSLDDIVAAFPGQKLPGAFLSRKSWAHLGMAALAILAYMAFFMFLASDGAARPIHVLFAGLFTATIGVGFLLLVQLLASLTDGRILIGFNPMVFIFAILKFIAFSYSAAMDPDNGFLLSFLGFTLGVGFCEEFVKMIPLFWYRSDDERSTWRGMMIWGMASGAGFGIAEGILYSARNYNGLAGPGLYVVRFASCVALHAIWSGSAAILMYHRRDLFTGLESWRGWIVPTIFVVAVSAVLHGLYDTCLKKEMNGFALVVAILSFAYLAFLLSRLQGGDDKVANEEMLAEYKRRRAAMR